MINDREQEWIDKYRAAKADAEPYGHSRWARLMRRVAVRVGIALGKRASRSRSGPHEVSLHETTSHSDTLGTVQKDDVA
jgi:hypothetical protein